MIDLVCSVLPTPDDVPIRKLGVCRGLVSIIQRSHPLQKDMSFNSIRTDVVDPRVYVPLQQGKFVI